MTKQDYGARTRRTYDVFARATHDEKLTRLGRVDAPNETLARVRAVTVYNSKDWLEMLLYPADTALEVNTDGQSRDLLIA